MTKIRAAITAVNGWVPDYIVSNKELETMVDTNDEWIVSRTGIKERRILKGEGLGTSDIGEKAVKVKVINDKSKQYNEKSKKKKEDFEKLSPYPILFYGGIVGSTLCGREIG